MKFKFQVRDWQGHKATGFLEAENKNNIVQHLLGKGYFIVSLKEVQQDRRDSLDLSSFCFNKVSIGDLVIFTRQLAAMLRAGLPILQCLKILGEQTANRRLRKAVLDIKIDVEGGIALGEALARHPDIFSRMYISMIKAGELGGILDTILDRLSHHLEREQEIQTKLKSASIYPLIIFIFALLVAFFIIIFVIPMFKNIFDTSGVQLPLPTRFLLRLSTIIRIWWVYILIGLAALIMLMKYWGQTLNGRYLYDSIVLKIPVAGKTISRMNVAQFARTMGTLIKSGIPVLQALEVVEEGVGNLVIGKTISRVRASIKEGESIARPLAEAGKFEPMVTQMITVGEATGSLEEMLIHISEYFERELIFMVDAMVAIVEPLLILLVALVIGGVVIATLLPIFDMMNIVSS